MKSKSNQLIIGIQLLALVGCGPGLIDSGEVQDSSSELFATGFVKADAQESTASSSTAKPRIYSLVSSSAGMTLRFSNPDPLATRISVYRKDLEEGYYRRASGQLTSRRTSYTFVDSNVTRGHEYCYMVTVRREGQSRGTSSDASCALHNEGIAGPQPPKAPSDLRVTRTYPETIKLSFRDESDNEDTFLLERRPVLDGPLAPWREVNSRSAVNGVGQSVSLTDSGLEMEQKYCYRVRANNEAGARISNTICAKTDPLAVSDPDPSLDYGPGDIPIVKDIPGFDNLNSLPGFEHWPLTVTMTHPRPNMLHVRWVEGKSDQSEWLVRLFEAPNVVIDRDELQVFTVRDNRNPPASSQSIEIENLNPDRRYCVQVVRTEIGDNQIEWGNILCESPFGSRTAESHLGPAAAPIIDRIELPARHQMRLRLLHNVEGQMIEVLHVPSGSRTNYMEGFAGAGTVTVDGLEDNQDYCTRMWLSNRYGTRYGPLQCFTTLPDNSQADSIEDCLSNPVECIFNFKDRYQVDCTAREPNATDPYWQGCLRASKFKKEEKSSDDYHCIPASKFGEWGCMLLDAPAKLCADNQPFNMTVYLTHSDMTLDCNHQTIDHNWEEGMGAHPGIRAPIEYSVSDIQIRNCNIQNVGRYGISFKRHFRGAELDGPMTGHRRIRVSNTTIAHSKRVGIYVGQNSHDLRFEQIWVHDAHTGFYLEAGSTETIISHASITGSRKGPGINIDSSQHNIVEHSTFQNNNEGGINLYKNCGEVYGQVCPVRRSLGASHNIIMYNQFHSEGVKVASRQFKLYGAGWCRGIDLAGYWRDRAADNTIYGNLFSDGAKLDIQDSPFYANDNLFVDSLLEIGTNDPIGDDPVWFSGTLNGNVFDASWIGVDGTESRSFHEVEVRNNRDEQQNCHTEYERKLPCHDSFPVVRNSEFGCFSTPYSIPGASCDN